MIRSESALPSNGGALSHVRPSPGQTEHARAPPTDGAVVAVVAAAWSVANSVIRWA